MEQETLDGWVETVPVVDPEVRAFVYSLVTALGGSDTEGQYVLGDDALAVLKDLRRWLKFYDQKLNRLDVARCLAESNLVKGDLLEILASWPEHATENKLKSKIALACLELMVPLTWPFEKHEMTMNHHRHIPYLQLAQIGYKRGILHYDKAAILRTAIRVALPSMAQPKNERESRDEGIIRLVLYFIRNISQISPSQNPSADNEGEDSDISRSVTINTFHEQDIFQLLLTISSSMGEEFNIQDVVVLEILFHLLKGVDAAKLFMEEKQLATAETDELKGLYQKEKAMMASYARHAPTRHNRFGSMIWVKHGDKENERISTVVGQDVLGNFEKSLQKMDKTKQWNKPRRRPKQEEGQEANEFDTTVPLSSSARKHLRAFVEEFLDSSFNPLMMHLRKAITNEAERVLKAHSMQYFYLISWFLEAERARRNLALGKKKKDTKAKTKQAASVLSDESFALVASVLNQETFILLNRHMQRSQDDKAWQDLNAGMKCFTQILLTVQQMADSPIEDDQEVAENIQNRIFYEETTHDRVLTILKSYKEQGFGYLDACTELSHVFIRMLERYSRQNVDLQVRSRRRARKKRKAAATANGETVDDNVEEADDIQAAAVVSKERKFDFNRFQAKFMTQSCVNTFISFTRYYADLNTEQLKRAHRYFYRLAFKMEMALLLYRVDILVLFMKMIKGPEGLNLDNPAFKEWEELVRQVFRRVAKKLEERPELFVEMLFSKIPATIYFLEHGQDREVIKRAPRPPAELEVRSGMSKSEEMGVVVSILINQGKLDALAWVKDVLSSAAEERQSWADTDTAMKESRQQQQQQTEDGVVERVEEIEEPKAPSIFIKPDNDDRRTALFKDNKLRLLLKVLGFERLGDDDDSDANWIIPSSLTASELKDNLDLINKLEFEPPTYEDGKAPEDFIRSKVAAATRRQRGAFDEDSDDDALASDDNLFVPMGPTARKSDALEQLKKNRRVRNRRELDGEELQRRAEARELRDQEKRKKIKSKAIISDDETDEEADRGFFAKEAERRRMNAGNILQAMSAAKLNGTQYEEPLKSKKRKTATESRKGRKRRKAVGSDSENEDHDSASSSRETSAQPDDPMDTDGEEEATDTPFSSQPRRASVSDNDDIPKIAKAAGVTSSITDGSKTDSEDGDDFPLRPPVRRNVRASFVVDSDSDQ